MATITLTAPGGRSVPAAIQGIADEARPVAADLLFAGQRQITRIRERTARGVDVDGQPFAPYSTKGPYYYTPGTRGGKVRSLAGVKLRASAERFRAKIAAGNVTPGGSIKFASYAAFKASLGRSTVDLTGAQGPHMLNAMQVLVTGDDLRIGFYGEEAARAEGNDKGIPGRLPARHFFGASEADNDAMLADVVERAQLRIKP